MLDLQRVYMDKPSGERVYGSIAARRAKTAQVFVLVDPPPREDIWCPASTWYPAPSWTEVPEDETEG